MSPTTARPLLTEACAVSGGAAWPSTPARPISSVNCTPPRDYHANDLVGDDLGARDPALAGPVMAQRMLAPSPLPRGRAARLLMYGRWRALTGRLRIFFSSIRVKLFV